MVDTRDTPTPTNTPLGIVGEGEYANAVAEHIHGLWDATPLVLTNVAGDPDNLTASCVPPVASGYVAGMSFWLTPLNTNEGAMSIDIDSQGAIELVDAKGEQLEGGDVEANRLYLLTVVTPTSIRINNVTAGTGAAGDTSGGANVQSFTSDGLWSKPVGANVALVQVWGAGGSGGRGGAADGGGGGGGGAYAEYFVPLSALPAQVAVTVGVGGAAVTVDSTNGAVGGDTSFGSFVTAFGGGGGNGNAANSGGGGGGGVFSAGTTASNEVGGNGGTPRGNLATTSGGAAATGFFGAGGATGVAGANGVDGGGGGGGGHASAAGNGGHSSRGGGGGGGGADATTAGIGGSSIWGGGGGGGGNGNGTGGVGGSSVRGGAGGTGTTGTTAATAGSTPGGGGGGSESADSGAGGDGLCIVTCW
jgi:hypothetical protein